MSDWRDDEPTPEKPEKDLPPARASDAEHVAKLIRETRERLGLPPKDAA